MPNKTIYVRDQRTWDRAKDLAEIEGLSLSAVIERELSAWVASHPEQENARIFLRQTEPHTDAMEAEFMEQVLESARRILNYRGGK